MIEIDEDKYDLLPFKESIHGRLKYDRKEYRRKWRSDYHKVNGISPWTICERVQRKFIGKSFDDAFSYYCKLVPKYQQRIFLEQFDKHKYRYRHWNYWYIDDGNIQYHRKKTDAHVCVTSVDYTTELRHKITGHKKDHFRSVYKTKHNYWSDFLYYEYVGKTTWPPVPCHLRYKAQNSDFENVIIKGWIQWFESKNDPRYQRYQAEKRKELRRKRRINRKLAEERDWESSLRTGSDRIAEFKRKQQEKIKREETLNLQTIERLGFDAETSFRTYRA